VVAIVVGGVSTLVLRRRAGRAMQRAAREAGDGGQPAVEAAKPR
jgi:hypothetical protein